MYSCIVILAGVGEVSQVDVFIQATVFPLMSAHCNLYLSLVSLQKYPNPSVFLVSLLLSLFFFLSIGAGAQGLAPAIIAIFNVSLQLPPSRLVPRLALANETQRERNGST